MATKKITVQRESNGNLGSADIVDTDLEARVAALEAMPQLDKEFIPAITWCTSRPKKPAA